MQNWIYGAEDYFIVFHLTEVTPTHFCTRAEFKHSHRVSDVCQEETEDRQKIAKVSVTELTKLKNTISNYNKNNNDTNDHYSKY